MELTCLDSRCSGQAKNRRNEKESPTFARSSRACACHCPKHSGSWGRMETSSQNDSTRLRFVALNPVNPSLRRHTLIPMKRAWQSRGLEFYNICEGTKEREGEGGGVGVGGGERERTRRCIPNLCFICKREGAKHHDSRATHKLPNVT